MKRECAWCCRPLPARPGDDPDDERVSHGICTARAEKQIEEDRLERLDLSARQTADVVAQSCADGLPREVADIAVPAVMRAMVKLGLLEGT